MKTLNKAVIAAVLLLCVPFLAHGQANTLTQTTLSAAITSSQTVFGIASATGVTAQTGAPGTATLLYIDREAMNVIALSGTTVTVSRGQNGTASSAHASGQMVLAGRPNWFYISDPAGNCVTANTLVTPYLNARTGNQWLCSTITLSWVPGFGNSATEPGQTADVASVAGTTTPSGPLFRVTGTNAITAWGIPIGCNATAVGQCSFTVNPNAAYTETATNNIAVATTAVANLQIKYTWDPGLSKWIHLQSK